MSLKPVDLEGHFARLEPICTRHRDDLRRAADVPAIWTYMPLDASGDGFDRWFNLAERTNETGHELIFAVINAKTGRAVGATRFMSIELAHKRLEIGHTWYAPDQQGSKINPECKYLMLRHSFEQLGLNRVELKCDARNARSRAAILKLGAKYEGLFRKHIVLRDGHLRDTAWFSVLDDEWPQVKAGLEQRLYGDAK